MANSKSNVVAAPKPNKSPEWLAVVAEGLRLAKTKSAFNLRDWLGTKALPGMDRATADPHLLALKDTSKEGNNVAALSVVRRAIILGSKGLKEVDAKAKAEFDPDATTGKSKRGYAGTYVTIANRVADYRIDGLSIADAIAKARSVKAPVGVAQVAQKEGANHVTALAALKPRLGITDAKKAARYTAILAELNGYF